MEGERVRPEKKFVSVDVVEGREDIVVERSIELDGPLVTETLTVVVGLLADRESE